MPDLNVADISTLTVVAERDAVSAGNTTMNGSIQTFRLHRDVQEWCTANNISLSLLLSLAVVHPAAFQQSADKVPLEGLRRLAYFIGLTSTEPWVASEDRIKSAKFCRIPARINRSMCKTGSISLEARKAAASKLPSTIADIILKDGVNLPEKAYKKLLSSVGVDFDEAKVHMRSSITLYDPVGSDDPESIYPVTDCIKDPEDCTEDCTKDLMKLMQESAELNSFDQQSLKEFLSDLSIGQCISLRNFADYIHTSIENALSDMLK